MVIKAQPKAGDVDMAKMGPGPRDLDPMLPELSYVSHPAAQRRPLSRG